MCLDLVDRAAEVAVLEPRGDERHLTKVLAHQLWIARRGPRSSPAPTPASAARPCRAQSCAASRAGSKRCASGYRTRTGIARSFRRRSPDIAPSHASDNCAATCSTVSPIRAAATGSTVHVDSDAAFLQSDDVDDAGDRFRAVPRSVRTIRSAAPDRRRRSSLRSASGLPSRSPSMSWSSWTNSISVSGTASVSLSRRSVMISSAIAVALAARLEPHEHVAAVHLRGEHAELGAGPAHVGGHFRRLREDGLDLLQPRVRLLECHARRRDVVDDESAFVGRGQEARAHWQVRQRRAAPASTRAITSASDAAASATPAASRRTSGRARRAGRRARVRPATRGTRRAPAAESGRAPAPVEISTATDSVIDSALKKSPTTPDSRPERRKHDDRRQRRARQSARRARRWPARRRRRRRLRPAADGCSRPRPRHRRSRGRWPRPSRPSTSG